MLKSHRQRRLAIFTTTALTLASSSVIAYRHLFHRPGESAVALIPADALMVATLDTNPAPSQVLLFNRLRDTFRDSGLGSGLDELFAGREGKTSAMSQLRPLLKDNYALAVLGNIAPDLKTPPEFALYFSVADGNGAADWLKANGKPRQSLGMRYYTVKDLDGVMFLQEDYLILAQNVDTLRKIAEVAAHRKPSLLEQPAYQEARNSLDPDANFMAFIAPKLMQSVYQQVRTETARTGNKMGSLPERDFLKFPSWVAVGATVRENGLSMDYQAPIDAAKEPILQVAAQIKPLDAAALKALPPNAYLVYSAAQPSGYIEMMKRIMGQSASAKKEVENGFRTFEKETGLSVNEDVLPAFRGDATFALYPDQGNPDGYLDGVIYLTDANNGDPASLVQKVKALVEKETAKKGGQPIGFVTGREGNATIIALNPRSEIRLQTQLVNQFEPTPAKYNVPQKRTSRRRTKGSRRRTVSYLPTEASAKPRGAYLKGKTVAWAVIGRSVILATSRPMLEKALASAEGRAPSLATDPKNNLIRQTLEKGSQGWYWIGLGQIMQKFRPLIEENFKNSDPTMGEDLLNLFGGEEAGLIASWHYNGKLAQGTLFYPMNWERALQLGGKFSAQMKKSKEKVNTDLALPAAKDI